MSPGYCKGCGNRNDSSDICDRCDRLRDDPPAPRPDMSHVRIPYDPDTDPF